MKLYLISGHAGTGKNTVADLIAKYCRSSNFSFADKVKSTATFSFGWDGKKDDRGRELLQTIGALGRKYHVDTWVRQTHRKIQDDLSHVCTDPNIVITISDWRYPTEFEYLNNTKVYDIVKVRVEAPQLELLKGTEMYNHESEISLPSGYEFPEYYNYVLSNIYTKENLEVLVKTMLEMEK